MRSAAAVFVALGLVGLTACGTAGRAGSERATQLAVRADPADVSTEAVERALLALKNSSDQRQTSARCRAQTVTEHARQPFGRSTHVVSCDVTIAFRQRRVRGRYDVKVLRNGCFVAERQQRRPRLGQVIDGCGVKR